MPPPRGTSDSPALAAAPSLVFEVRKVVGTFTNAGPGSGYRSLELTMASGAALELLHQLGPDAFIVLQTLVLLTEEADDQLVVTANSTDIGAHLGWHRAKASRLITQLETAGFLAREQEHLGRGKGEAWGRVRYVLSPTLYRAVERRLSITHSDRPLGVNASAVTKRDTTDAGAEDLASGVGSSAVTNPNSTSNRSGVEVGAAVSCAVTNLDTTDVPAGQRADASRDTTELANLHGYEGMTNPHLSSTPHVNDNEAITLSQATAAILGTLTAVGAGPSPLGQDTIAVTNDTLPRLTDSEMVALLRGWHVYDAERLVASTARHVLDTAVQQVGDNWDNVKKPGAYLRRLLAEAATPATVPQRPPGSSPAPAPTRSTATESTGTSVGQRSVSDDTFRPFPQLSNEDLVAVCAALPDDIRHSVEAKVLKQLGIVQAVGLVATNQLTRLQRLCLISTLDAEGLLPQPGDVGNPVPQREAG